MLPMDDTNIVGKDDLLVKLPNREKIGEPMQKLKDTDILEN